MGRETFLLRVRCEGGWPRFLDPGEAMPPLVRRPALPTDTAIDRSAWSEDFDAPALSPEWRRVRGRNRPGCAALNWGALVMCAGHSPADTHGQLALAWPRQQGGRGS